MTPYGKKAAVDFGTQLARAGICVISGMAVGVDIMSMKAALKAGGYVIGVLGCGIDVNYPAENAKMKELVSKVRLYRDRISAGHRPLERKFPSPQPVDFRPCARHAGHPGAKAQRFPDHRR